MDAHLATVHSADELHFLGVAVDTVNFKSESAHNGEYWVGAVRERRKPFIWTDGTSKTIMIRENETCRCKIFENCKVQTQPNRSRCALYHITLWCGYIISVPELGLNSW